MSSSLISCDIADTNLLVQNACESCDQEILKSYEAIVDGLAMLLGPHCEVALHSPEDLQYSATRIADEAHTEHTASSPAIDMALRMLRDKIEAKTPVCCIDFTRDKSGALVKSATIAVKNHCHQVIGLLCININLDVPFSQVISTFLPSETVGQKADVNFASSIEALVAKELELAIEEVNADRSIANNIKNRQIVHNLYEKGIFDIKDAINQVARRLDISRHTVYLYIRKFKNSGFPEQDS